MGGQSQNGAKHSSTGKWGGVPEGGNRGGLRHLWQGYGFSICSVCEHQQNKTASVVPYCLKAVD